MTGRAPDVVLRWRRRSKRPPEPQALPAPAVHLRAAPGIGLGLACPAPLTCGNVAANSSQGITISYRGRGTGPTTLGEQLKKKTIRLGAAGALTALSLAGFAVPAHAGFVPSCGPIVDSVKLCTAPDGSQ